MRYGTIVAAFAPVVLLMVFLGGCAKEPEQNTADSTDTQKKEGADTDTEMSPDTGSEEDTEMSSDTGTDTANDTAPNNGSGYVVTADPAVNGSYTIAPPLPEDGHIEANTVLTVSATAADGYQFDGGYAKFFNGFYDEVQPYYSPEFSITVTREISIGVSFQPVPVGYSVTEDIVYGSTDDKELVYDIYSPDGAENVPIVVIIHGGGWTSGDENVMRGMARQMASRPTNPFVVAAITYRFLGTADGGDTYNEMPSLIADCFGAIAHIQAHAAEYGGDPNQICVTGDSAGGHLAASVATMADMIGTAGFGATEGVYEYWPTGVAKEDVPAAGQAILDALKAVAPSYGIFKRYADGETTGWGGSAYISPDFENEADKKNSAHHMALSPIEQISADDENKVPCLQSRGSMDMLISLADVDAYRSVLSDADYEEEYIEVTGANHAFYDWKPDAATQQIFATYGEPNVQLMMEFFDRYIVFP